MRKVFMGVRLQRLREERGISQVALARTLGISASYLNQIERNQRPLTLAILLRINEQLGVDVQPFADDEAAQMIADVRDALVETGADTVSIAELRALSANMPGIARAVIEMHRRNRVLSERADTLTAQMGDGNTQMQSFALPQNHDEVRDYLNRRHNHIAELDTAAEAIFRESALNVGDAAPQLVRRLADRHGVRVIASADSDLEKGRYERATRTLSLPDHLRPGQQAFQMAVQLAMLELPAQLDALIAEGGFAGKESQRLARIGLANYFAGALVMPYGEFLHAAETMSYDIERLANRFGVGAEAICHRLSTLQRPESPGLPFFFVRVDRAGNVSKRHSATDFHFSRIGGTCPLWIVYEAFSQPDRVLTQIASMPDGRTYFWIARQVVSGAVGYGRPQKTFAVGLGCDLRHAHRLVYSRGLDLQGPVSATPIGVGCKVCERQHCAQRASPSLLER